MACRLARFYGGDPWRWLTEVPLGVVKAGMRWMTRLHAEESLRQTSEHFAGGGFGGETAKALIGQWTAETMVPGRMTADEQRAARRVQQLPRTVEDVRRAGLRVFSPKASADQGHG